MAQLAEGLPVCIKPGTLTPDGINQVGVGVHTYNQALGSRGRRIGS